VELWHENAPFKVFRCFFISSVYFEGSISTFATRPFRNRAGIIFYPNNSVSVLFPLSVHVADISFGKHLTTY